MANIGAKRLASGFIPTTLGVIYTVPPLTKSYIRFFSIANVGVSIESVVLRQRYSGSLTTITPNVQLNPNEFAYILSGGEVMTLDGGTIEAATNTSGSVAFLLTGAEEI